MSDFYIINPKRLRHLGTLKSISGALYNMDMAEIEAANREHAQHALFIEVMRQELEAERIRPRGTPVEENGKVLPFPSRP